MQYSFNGSREDLEKLISQAVNSLLSSGVTNTQKPDTAPTKVLSPAPLASILVAVCCSECLSDNVKDELRKIQEQQIKIHIEEADEFDETTVLQDLISPHQIAFFPALSENVVAKAATGIFDEPLSRLLLQAIEAGKPIIAIAPEPSEGLRNNSPALFRLRQTHRQKIAQFGIRLITQKDIVKVLLSALPKSTFKNRPQPIHGNNKPLLTAEDVEKAAREGMSKLVIPYRGIVTPLAKDRARDLNITIELKG